MIEPAPAPVTAPPWRAVLPDAFGLFVAGALAAGIAEIVLPGAIGPIRLGMVLDVGIVALAAGGLALSTWAIDRVSLGHATLVAIGAYAAAAVAYYGQVLAFGSTQHEPLTPLVFLGALAAGALAAGAVGAALAALGAPARDRTRGLGYPVLTLVLGVLVRRGLDATPEVLADPTTIRTTPLSVLATCLGGEVGFTSALFLTTPVWVGAGLAGLLGVTLAVKRRPPRSFGGRVAVAGAGAAFAGLAGGLLAHHVGAVQRPDAFGLGPSLELFAVASIAGWGSVTGAVLAAIVAVLLREIPAVDGHRILVYGAVVAAVWALRARGRWPRGEPWQILRGPG